MQTNLLPSSILSYKTCTCRLLANKYDTPSSQNRHLSNSASTHGSNPADSGNPSAPSHTQSAHSPKSPS